MKIAIASDHAGYKLKEYLKKTLEKEGYEVADLGTYSSESVDYPDYATKLAKLVSKNLVEKGILICGTGIGMSIAANKFPGVRAAVCWSEETAALSRRHNDANILCLGGRVLKPEKAAKILKIWLSTEFEGGRHFRRIQKIKKIEEELYRSQLSTSL
ncbi:MAG: ribose 5-phosphate isomerase B [Thermoprotei archaeon]|nr:MAG: ribose 5-phosphate isomerase B [Thermoprotei archaeon]